MAQSSITSLGLGVPGSDTILPYQIRSTFGGFYRNKIINGDFNIAQRGTSFSTPNNGAYNLDRWLVSYDGTIGTFSVSQQSFTVGQTDVPDEPEFFLRWNHTSAGSGSSYRRIEQRMENVRSLALKNVTITFYGKADSSRNVDLDLIQNFGSGGSSDVSTSGGTLGFTSSWQRFSVNVTLPSISGKTVGSGNYLSLRLSLPINVTMTIDISHVQVEENGFTPFERIPYSLQQSLCERYYQVAITAVGSSNVSIPFKTVMRAAPTISGGGSGFTSSGVVASGGVCLQTSPATQTLTLEAEL